MYSLVGTRLARLRDTDGGASLRGGLVGLEKENLRVSPDGRISPLPHPTSLGAALTHPHITTDYSEALLEFITPPAQDKSEVLAFLHDIHTFVYERLEDDEVLWATSMPCVLEGGGCIPVARYGGSNAGMMKTVYRRGLGHRYGRTMQVISGVHFNYSLPESFWPIYRKLEGVETALQNFVSENYFCMIRNLQRYGWLVPYLFGASPAVCKSFLGDKPTDLQEFNESTYYYPYATSLRMGDIGYQNSLEEGRGFKANYDGLEPYVRSLSWATQTPCSDNEKIGILKDGEYRQLNHNVLQIENEHYSTIRPKQVTQWLEKPALALRRRGVSYVELRSLDVNALNPLGVAEDQLYFLEAFLLFCLLDESPRIAVSERKTIDVNQIIAAHRGREPGVLLQHKGRDIGLRDWARDLLDAMGPLCELLDEGSDTQHYAAVLQRQRGLVADPDLTPSARMLANMHGHGEGFFQHAQRMSLTHRDYFRTQAVRKGYNQLFETEAMRSHERQRQLEADDDRPFDEFLASYFAQH